jgi:FkbM family methyltransferase
MDTLPEATRRRVEQTVAVRDTDAIPKVPDAGHVVEREGRRVQIMHNGALVEAGGYHGDWMIEVIQRLGGHHEPQEELAFHTVIERLAQDTEQPIMVELGAFWAYYSIWAKRRIPATRLVLVEPDETNLAVGRRNLALNDLAATFIQAAVGAEHNAQIDLTWESDDQIHPTRVVSVDGLLADEALERIDLLLVDVQGAELEVLRGAARALADGRLRFLVVSTHHHSISRDPLTHQRCRAYLLEVGAHIIAEHTVLESCSGDGLILASMSPADRDLHADVSIVRARDSVWGEPEYELAEAGVGTWWSRYVRGLVLLKDNPGRIRPALRRALHERLPLRPVTRD